MNGDDPGVPWPYNLPDGSELKAYRLAVGATQKGVAEASGVDPRTVRKAETDPSSIRVGTLRSILGALAAHR